MILVIDNYDSFVETLARYAREQGGRTRVVRNDVEGVDGLLAMSPQAVILSPGPGRPEGAGVCRDLIRAMPDIPILGVCLGHQALAEVYGGATVPSPEPMHGRASRLIHRGDPLFEGVPSPFPAGRYHSLLGELPADGPVRPIAWTGEGMVMALRHRTRPHIGVQFHPESLLTPDGRRIIANFLNLAKRGDDVLA